MARIGAHISGLERKLLNLAARSDAAAATNALRLATDLKINAPSDDPARFIQVTSLRNELNNVNSTIKQVEAANSTAALLQLTIDQTRTEINTIRTTLLTDEDQSLSASARIAAQVTIDASLTKINSLASTEVNGRRVLDGSADFDVSGQNTSQIRDIRVYSTAGPSLVTRLDDAEVIHTTTAGSLESNANITLTGNRGSHTFALTNGTSLDSVVATINAQVRSTGVEASVDGKNLLLRSEKSGATQSVTVVLNSGTFNVTTGGVAKGTDVALASGPAVAGSVKTAATQAQEVYTGSSGNTTAAATLTLTGKLGNTSVTVTNGEALTAVRDRINLDTHKTGITAAVSGDNLTLSSVDYGAKSTVAVAVSSGTFTVTGADADGTARGTDVVAKINGRDYAGGASDLAVDGNQIRVNSNGFHFTVDLVAGFTGSLDTVSISKDPALSFALTTDPKNTTTLGVGSLKTLLLGGLSGTLDNLSAGGSLADLATNTSQAIRVVDEALSQLADIEATIDGFANASVASSTALSAGMKTILETAIDDIDDANATEETLLLAKNQNLATNARSSLTILQNQQFDTVTLLRKIAGLI